MARALHAIREKQTDARVRDRLGSVAFTTIGHALKACAPSDAHAFGEVLQKLEPSDLLLRRDAIRHAEGRFQHLHAPTKAHLPAKGPVNLTKGHEWSLPKDDDIAWNRLLTSGDSWLVRGSHCRSVQELWMLGTRDTTVGKLTPCTSKHSTSHLQAHLLKGSTAWLPFSRGEQGTFYGCARLEDFRNPPSSPEPLISRLAWMPPAVMAICPTQDGVWILHPNESSAVDLSHYTQEGKLQRTYALGRFKGGLPESMQMVAHGDHVWISAGGILLYVKHGKAVEQMELLEPVTRLVASPNTHAPAVLASTADGVKLITVRNGLEQTTVGDDGKASRVGTFFGDGRILVGNWRRATIYPSVADLKETGSIDPPEHVLDYAPWSVDSVALLCKDGIVRIYR
jgi:hypothetical protein